MKLLFIICLIFLNANFCLSQITGMCIDTLGQPIPYVNIGLKNTTIGTVTNEEGRFVIDGKSLIEKNCLIISHIGYKTKSVVVAKQTEIKIVLQQIYYQLDEVTIVPSQNAFTKVKQIGPKILSKHIVAGFFSTNLGTESGRFFKLVKGKKYKVVSIHLNIAELGFKKGTFRINFYNANDEQDVEKIRCNKKDIIFEVSRTGDIDIDLNNENLIFSNSFLTSIEWIGYIKDNSLKPTEQRVAFCSNVFCGPFYYRFNNLSKWTIYKEKYDSGLGIQLFVKY